MDRFVIRDDDSPAISLGIHWLVSYAREHVLANATIYTHSRAAVENLAEAIGDRQASSLYRHHRVTTGGVIVESATRRDTPTIGAPVLAVWVTDSELIDRLDRLNIPALCAIPWSDELANWIAMRHPIDVTTGDPVAIAAATISNPVVLRAVESITATSNLANGFDSRNRARIGHALTILRDGARRWTRAKLRRGQPSTVGGQGTVVRSATSSKPSFGDVNSGSDRCRSPQTYSNAGARLNPTTYLDAARAFISHRTESRRQRRPWPETRSRSGRRGAPG